MARSIQRVVLPTGSLVAALPFRDYADAFRVDLDEARFPNVDTFARAFLTGAPAWVNALMRVRDAAAGVVGLKKSTDAPPQAPLDGALHPGTFVQFFRIVDRDDREIIAGEDDRHLDFRVSFFHVAGTNRCHAIVSTVVRFHGALGRAYFLPVAPMHRIIVPAMIRRAIGATSAEP
jgi:hypothetical protein